MLLFHLDRVTHILLSNKKTGRDVNAFLLLFFSNLRFKLTFFMIPTFIVTLCMSGSLFLVIVEVDVELFDGLK